MNHFDLYPLNFNPEHCAKARELLSWSVAYLARESGVSVAAIEGFEAGLQALCEVTRQALAFRLEVEGLVFINGHPPLWGMDVRGGTPDPQSREDFHLVE